MLERKLHFARTATVDLLIMDELYQRINKHGGDFEVFIHATGRHYIEAQLWSDKYISKCRKVL